jgi:hypothetical protein
MKKRPGPAKSSEQITIEPGAHARLAGILKKTLNTPPKHVPAKGKNATAHKK